ncbi:MULTISPECIES: hypothetical protein [Labedella]|nr:MULTISPECIES: hypothetical protein [Labedella]
MTDNVTPATTPAASRTGQGEKTAWWITFGVLTLAIVTMLSLWN